MYNRRDKRKYVNLVLELIKYLQTNFVPIYLLKEHSNKSNFDIKHVRTSFFLTIYACVYVKRLKCLPIIDLAGTAFHSSQNVINDDVTRIIPGMKKVVK